MAMIISPLELKKAVKIIANGGIVAYPTETFYGLGVSALDKKAIEKVFCVKQRPPFRPLPILIPNIDWLKKIVKEIPFSAKLLSKHFWPGPLTLVFKSKDILPENLTANTGKIAVRISSHPIAQKLVKSLNLPITTTSANPFNKPPPTSLEEISPKIKAKIAAIIDGGKTKGGLPSTIIDVTLDPPVCLRRGVIYLEQIFRKTGLKINANPGA